MVVSSVYLERRL